MNSSKDGITKALNIPCEDGVILSATLFLPKHVKAAVMVAPATGIKQQFYANFAQHLSEHGFAVITYDNRGIGQSKGKDLNQVNATLVNWGQQDMTAILEALKVEVPRVNYHLIGHSAGGQLVGLMKNAKDLSSMLNYGCSSGSLHYAKYPFKLLSFFFLNIYIPTCNFMFGQTQSQWVGMGEPLPKKIGQDWSRWCNGTGYVKVDLDHRIKDHFYYDLNLKSLWMHSSDDEIANADTVNDMIRVFRQLQAEVLTLHPKTYGFKDLGHMKFFSRKRKDLWSIAIDWLNSNG